MLKRVVVVLGVVMTASLLPAGSASADHFRDTKCAASGDYCVSVKKVDGVRRLRLGTLFRYFPRHELCVKGPADDRTCTTYRTRRIRGVWGSSIDWRDQFPFEGRGIYRVTWRTESGPLSSLRFHVRGGAA
jgi:hypothetical protein